MTTEMRELEAVQAEGNAPSGTMKQKQKSLPRAAGWLWIELVELDGLCQEMRLERRVVAGSNGALQIMVESLATHSVGAVID